MQQLPEKATQPIVRQITQRHAKISEQFKQMNNSLKLQT